MNLGSSRGCLERAGDGVGSRDFVAGMEQRGSATGVR
jgi:hypothetical protein